MTAQAAPAPTTPEDIRRRLGDRYAIERELGRGGMGSVYLARERSLDRPVALKVLPPEFASDPALRERFLRETRTAASFSHPNIVPVFAVEEGDGILAFAMGYVEGESLGARVRRTGPLATREIVRVLQDIGYALAYAHGRGVVHRDIKPDNIMIERATGRALLMDFGIARAITAPSASEGLTRVGEVVGTPEYMSPEQASGDVVDGRSDIYSLGLVAWFAATGETAMTGETTQKILVRQLTEAVPPVAARRPDLPAPLAAAVDRCTAKEPSERFESAEALVETIDAAQLAAPEIPLHVRLFSQELATLSLVAMFIVVISWAFVTRALASSRMELSMLVPVLLLFTIGMTRLMQVYADARRLAVMGFGADEVIAGLRRTVAEREEVRDQLRADPDTRRRRKATIRIAAAQVALAVALLGYASTMRQEIAPGEYVMPRPVMVMVVSAIIMLGTGLVLLFRSPFRAAPPERLFRRVWIGPLGRAFVRQAGRGVKRSAAGASRNASAGSGVAAAVAPPPPSPRATPAAAIRSAAVAPGADARVVELERRVSALERWRADVAP